PAVLDLLPANNPSPETRARLARIRQHFADKRAVEQLQTGSAVTLSGTFVLEEGRAEILKQNGHKVARFRQLYGLSATNPQLKMELKTARFWPAVDAVLDSAQLRIYSFSGDDGGAIADRAAGERPRRDRGAYAGPLRIEATRLASERRPGSKDSATLAVN